MDYMVIERYKPGSANAIYRRFAERGRMIPDGLEYVDSWVDFPYTTCWQVMRTDDEALLREWASHWEDLVDFEFIPVRTSRDAAMQAGERGE